METVTDLDMYGKMVGEIWSVYCKPYSMPWEYYHMLVLEVRKGIAYNDCDTVAHCIVLETGQTYDMYTDVLQGEGRKVA